MSDLVFTKGSTPSIPPSGTSSIYAKNDGLFYTQDDAGTETPLKGATGATGATGPTGPVYSPPYAVVTTGTSIPATQNFTIVNASGITTQTLPLISAVFALLTAGTTVVFTVANVTSHKVSVVASGSDTILVGSPVIEPFANDSFSFVPTSLGWVVI